MATNNTQMIRHETTTVFGQTRSRRETPNLFPGTIVTVENIANRWLAEIVRVTRVGRDLKALLVEVKPFQFDEFIVCDANSENAVAREMLTFKVTDDGLPYGINSDYAYSVEVAR